MERAEVARRMEEIHAELMELWLQAGGIGWEPYQVRMAADYVDWYRQRVELGEDGWRVWRRVLKVQVVNDAAPAKPS